MCILIQEETEIEPVANLFKITKKEFMDKYIEITINGYEVSLKPAINKGWLVNFRYYGIYERTIGGFFMN